MRKGPPSMDFFGADFAQGVRLLEADEVGAYILLLIWQWDRGYLPESDRQRQLVAQVTDCDQWQRIWSAVRQKFVPIGIHDIVGMDPAEPERLVLVNERMHYDRQRTLPEYHARVERNRANGKLGGRRKKNPDGNPVANPLGSQSLTQTEPRKNPPWKREEGSRKKDVGRGTEEGDVARARDRAALDETLARMPWSDALRAKWAQWVAFCRATDPAWGMVAFEAALRRTAGWPEADVLEAIDYRMEENSIKPLVRRPPSATGGDQRRTRTLLPEED